MTNPIFAGFHLMKSNIIFLTLFFLAGLSNLSAQDPPEEHKVRFRTLGCYPLTGAILSDASTLDEVIAEMTTSRMSERQGRVIDRDQSASMEKKKREGYF